MQAAPNSPFGRDQLQGRDSDVSFPRPTRPAAGRMSASPNQVLSSLSATISTNPHAYLPPGFLITGIAKVLQIFLCQLSPLKSRFGFVPLRHAGA